MASLKNAFRSKAHKERSQPAKRRKLGLLEKHKDYVLRAKDFHFKEKRVKALKEKASFRNPDEFYFGMTNAQTQVGAAPACGCRGRVAARGRWCWRPARPPARPPARRASWVG